MQRFIPLAVLLLIALIGFIDGLIQKQGLKNRLHFAYDYRNKFIDLINGFASTGHINDKLYIELTEKVSQIQSDMGIYGLASYIDNMSGIKVNNQQFIVNFLPQIREMPYWSDNTIMQQRFMTNANTCDDMFIRYTGNLKSIIDSVQKSLYNPFSNLSKGVIMSLPVSILLWCGFITVRIEHKIKNSRIVKIITIVITLIGLLSSIVTIIIGWKQFTEMINGWINGLQH